jgi:tryptophan synthase alpha chain
MELCSTEGIIPAIESAHALAEAIKLAPGLDRDKIVVVNLSGRGDPDLGTTVELVLAMEQAGADIIELGIPYSDPLADGVIIQESSNRALKGGAKISGIMGAVMKIRDVSQVPLVYLVYYNSVFRYGIEKFLRECSGAGVDGVIIPDLPIERNELGFPLSQYL